MNDQGLRRFQSDISSNVIQRDDSFVDIIVNNGNITEKVECKCCGLTEDCTPGYINNIKVSHCGKWVCGLCSEAVKDRLTRANPAGSITIEEAVSCHTDFCQKFNRTTRLNPKLSLAWAMKDIARRSSQKRASGNSTSLPKIARTSSCFPSIVHRD